MVQAYSSSRSFIKNEQRRFLVKQLTTHFVDNVLELPVHPDFGRFRAFCCTNANASFSGGSEWKKFHIDVGNIGMGITGFLTTYISEHKNSAIEAYNALLEVFPCNTQMFTCIAYLNTGQTWKCTRKSTDYSANIKKFLDYTDWEERPDVEKEILLSLFSRELHGKRGKINSSKFGI